MSSPADRSPGVFHRDPATAVLVARIGLIDGRIEAAALTALADAVADVGADHIQLTAHHRLEVHGIADRHVGEFGDRLADAGLGAPLAVPVHREGDGMDPQVGWFAHGDGLVRVGAVTAHGRLSAEQAKYAGAIGVPVTITRRREIVIDGIGEAVADTVVRVLAPLGFIFDANSEWASPAAVD
ncbi:hypothetical protein [Gordonia hydrophobica]|uniref:Nitrite/Sulfite reductase ferredoxin-like domain-containing protein n=1 Tax=Gordonia hydrophobica TaxID=40516 RepID=A0ABZ2U055_9ACTN|nr:hypothetical protein [Gordonia hydrophobica]MBM7369378.1 precorrin-3B synthase [Gordonia hydrophobica]